MKSLCTDRSRCRTAYAGQTEYLLMLLRELPTVNIHNHPCSAVQVSSSCVITQPAPVGQHFFLGSICQGHYIREGSNKAQVIGNDGGDLRLLQHDFRQPYAIRVSTLPGQVIAAMFALPADEGRRKCRHQGRNIKRRWIIA